MFIGHFGIAFAARRIAPRLSLGTAFLAAQFCDLLWPTLVLAGVEQVRIVPGATAVTPLVFDHYPVSHSLLLVAAWGALLGAAHFAWRRDARTALVVAGLVVSHWLLDAVVHGPDLPLLLEGPMVGLGLWNSRAATLAVEVPLFAAGVWLYASATTPIDRVGRWALRGLVALLALIYVGNLWGAPPPNPAAIGWLGQAQWLLVAWAYWLDRHRSRGRAAAAPAAA